MKINMTEHEAGQYSPLTLAFLGDSVYEQMVREKLVLTANMPANKLHKLAVERVRAEYQSMCVEKLTESGFFSENESEILKRGKNAKVNAPKHSTVAQYRNATGLECLLGYLYLINDTRRIEEIFGLCWEYGNNNT
ncbi:MAG: ribonuclease III [Ruminococcus sp.]|nr:ribonuclease III [Ruminococcus sp.]